MRTYDNFITQAFIGYGIPQEILRVVQPWVEKECGEGFHAVKPINKCRLCVNKAQRVIEEVRRAKTPLKKPYPFNNRTNEAGARFCSIRTALSNAWKEIKIAAMGEEDEPIDTEMPSFMSGLGQDKAHVVTERLLRLAQSQFEYLNSMLDDSDQMRVENLTDTEDQGHLISMLWDRTNQCDDDEVGLVLEYLSDWIDAHPGESVFNYATLKPIVEEVFMRN